MMHSLKQVGVVVVTDRTILSGLAKLALRHGWDLIHLPTASCVTRTIGRRQVDMAVVQIAVNPQQSIEFIQWLRVTRRNVILIAVAPAHREEVEYMVRQAGAHCYVTQTDEISLERTVTEILRQQAARQEFRKTMSTHAHERHRGTSGVTVARPDA
jgi:DNA-binding response OmpR family regulator